MTDNTEAQRGSLRAIEWTNFFLADVQTGLGPFLAAYLASSGWSAATVGYVLTLGGLVTVAMQTPAGAVVDAVHRKRALLLAGLGVLVAGAFLLMGTLHPWAVYSAQVLIGGAAPFLGPTVAAITLGVVGAKGFDRQFGRNQSFNSTGNVFAALLIAGVSYEFGYRAIFIVAAVLALPAAVSISRIDPRQIDYARSRGAKTESGKHEGLQSLLRDRVLLAFLASAFLFHTANAAMLPDLGEMLARGRPRTAAPFMAACVIVTQMVIACSAAWIGRLAGSKGRKPLLLVGFGVLPVRGVLYTLTSATSALIAIQTLDGVANAIFGVVSILVIADRTRGTGRFNLAAGALATMVGIGAAVSTTVGGQLIHRMGYHASFLGLAGIAGLAFGVLLIGVPETMRKASADVAAMP